MSDKLASPLGALIKRAAESLPAETGAVARHAARLAGATDATVVLADVSGSMAEPAGGRTKIDILREALDYALAGTERLVAFASFPRDIPSPAALPRPAGSTALHLALDHAARYRPARTLVISDGRPDDAEAALVAAATLTGRIDAIYCGPDSDHEAIAFLRGLCAAGGGHVHVYDVVRSAAARRELPAGVRALLGGGR